MTLILRAQQLPSRLAFRRMEREYFYRVDASGQLSHDASVLSDPAFLDFFFKRLVPNNTGRHPEFPYVSPCAGELNFVAPAGAPIVFHSLTQSGLRYAASLAVPFFPEKLRFQAASLLYPVSPGVYGRPGTQLAMELGRHIAPFGPWYSFREGDLLHVIAPLEEDPDRVVFRPESGVSCFGCGADAERGIRLPFLFQKSTGEACTWFSPPSWTTGHPGIVHGGFVGLFLDEVMAKVLKGMGLRGMTANLNVDFKKPVRAARPLALCAVLERMEGRKAFLLGTVCDAEEGTVLAEGRALYITRTAPALDPSHGPLSPEAQGPASDAAR